MPRPGQPGIHISSSDALLLALGDDAARIPEWASYANYCRDRVGGLRQRALGSLRSLLSDANSWSESARRDFTRWLCNWLERYPSELRRATPEPLVEQLLYPVLQRWNAEAPDDILPHRWLGMFFGGHPHWVLRADVGTPSFPNVRAHLRRAIGLDPREQPARIRLAVLLCEGVEFDVHHLPKFYIGEPAEALLDLEEAREVVAGIEDAAMRVRMDERITSLRQLVEDWMTFKSEGGNDFDLWCRLNKREYQWVRHYYY